MVMIIVNYDDDDDESVEDGDVCKFGTGAPSSVRGAQNLHSSVGKRRQRRTQLAAHCGKVRQGRLRKSQTGHLGKKQWKSKQARLCQLC